MFEKSDQKYCFLYVLRKEAKRCFSDWVKGLAIYGAQMQNRYSTSFSVLFFEVSITNFVGRPTLQVQLAEPSWQKRLEMRIWRISSRNSRGCNPGEENFYRSRERHRWIWIEKTAPSGSDVNVPIWNNASLRVAVIAVVKREVLCEPGPLYGHHERNIEIKNLYLVWQKLREFNIVFGEEPTSTV